MYGKRREVGEKIRVMSGRKLHPLIQQIKSHDFGFHVAYDPLSAAVIQLVSRLVLANQNVTVTGSQG